ncbi:MAG: sensor histidine kinase [Candidatus Dormibacteraceae bacterium]
MSYGAELVGVGDGLPSLQPRSAIDDRLIEERVRRELARDLHDQVAQTLTSMLMELESFKRDQVGRLSVIREVAVLESSTREVLHNVRQLLSDLRGQPSLTDDFVKTVRHGLLAQFQERTGISVRLTVRRGWPKLLPRQTAMNLYRIIQEALNNAYFHSGASEIRVTVGEAGPAGRLAIEIADNGNGFPWGQPDEVGFGILGMKERALVLGGELIVESAPGRGSSVRARFPAEAVR